MKIAGFLLLSVGLPLCILGYDLSDTGIDLSLLEEQISEEQLENYLEDFISNPLEWNRSKPADIEMLPLNDALIDRLVALKKSSPRFADWRQFQDAAQLDQRSLQTVKLFFKIEGDRFDRAMNLVNYISVHQKEEVDLNRSQLRGSIAVQPRLTIGFIVERDREEKQLFDYRNVSVTAHPFSDFYTVGLAAYKLNWGHGLLFSRSNLAFKGTSVSGNVMAGTPRFSPHNGADENRYLWGGYFSRERRRLTLFSFVSRQHLDATIEDSMVSGFRETGTHSTDSEWAAKDTLLENTVGGGIYLNRDRAFLGLMVFQSAYSHPIAAYGNQNRRRGVSLFHKFRWGDWRFSGEIALLNPQNYALMQGFVCRVENISIGVQYRYFCDHYAVRLMSVMKEYTSVGGNEQGLYMGLECRLKKGLKAGGYIDFFAQHRSFADGAEPRSGTEAVAFLDRSWVGHHSLRLRLKRAVTGTANARHQLSAVGRYYVWSGINLTLRGVVNAVNRQYSSAASIAGTFRKQDNLSLTLGTTHFFSPNFDTRIYLYEAGIPMRFNMVSLMGTGRRCFGTVQYRFENGTKVAVSLKTQKRRLLADNKTSRTFLLEFQMVVDL